MCKKIYLFRKSRKNGEVKTQGKLKDQGKPQNSSYSTSRRHFPLPKSCYVKKSDKHHHIVLPPFHGKTRTQIDPGIPRVFTKERKKCYKSKKVV